MIYRSTDKGPFKVAGSYDPNSKRLVGIIYRPPAWTSHTPRVIRSPDDYDIVAPTVYTGYYYMVISAGVSGLTEPVWPTMSGQTVMDGTAKLEAVPYNLLPEGVTITASTFTATDGVPLTQSTFTSGTTQVLVGNVPTGVVSFKVTNHIVKSNGEEDDVTLQFKVGER